MPSTGSNQFPCQSSQWPGLLFNVKFAQLKGFGGNLIPNTRFTVKISGESIEFFLLDLQSLRDDVWVLSTHTTAVGSCQGLNNTTWVDSSYCTTNTDLPIFHLNHEITNDPSPSKKNTAPWVYDKFIWKKRSMGSSCDQQVTRAVKFYRGQKIGRNF